MQLTDCRVFWVPTERPFSTIVTGTTMPRPNEDIHELWRMSPLSFNEWRRKNDLVEGGISESSPET